MSDQWYYRAFGEQFGPMPFESIAELARDGHLSPSDEVKGGDEGEWVPAETIVGLFPEPEELHDLSDLDFQFEENTSGPVVREPTGQVTTAVSNAEMAPSPAESGSEDDFELHGVFATPPPAQASGTVDAARPDDHWYCRCLGQEMGPMLLDELQQLAAGGTLSSDDPVRRGDDGDWVPARSIGEFMFPGSAAQPENESATVETAPSPAELWNEAEASASGRQEARVRREETDETTHHSPLTAHPASTDDIPDDVLQEILSSGPEIAAVAGEETGVRRPEIEEAAPRSPLTTHSASTDETAHSRAAGSGAAEVPAGPDVARSVQPARPAAAPGKTASPSSAAEQILVSAAAGQLAGSQSRAPVSRPAPVKPPKKKPRRSKRGGSGGGIELIEQHGLKILVGVVAVALLAGAVFLFSGGRSATFYYDELNAIWTEHKQLRQQKASPQQWEDLKERAKPVAEMIKAELEYPGVTQEPAKAALLFAGRDYLLPMLDDSRKEPGKSELRFQAYMKAARQLIETGEDLPPEPAESTPAAKTE